MDRPHPRVLTASSRIAARPTGVRTVGLTPDRSDGMNFRTVANSVSKLLRRRPQIPSDQIVNTSEVERPERDERQPERSN